MRQTIVLTTLLLSSIYANSQSADLYVELLDFIPGKGQFILAVFNSPEEFDAQERPVYYQTVDVNGSGGSATKNEKPSPERIIFRDIVPGTYAIAVFQDIDMNGKLDKNFLGVPSEPYGFSGGKTHRWRPPSFEEASFRIAAGKDQTERIVMLQW